MIQAPAPGSPKLRRAWGRGFFCPRRPSKLDPFKEEIDGLLRPIRSCRASVFAR